MSLAEAPRASSPRANPDQVYYLLYIPHSVSAVQYSVHMTNEPKKELSFTRDGAGNLDQTLRPQTWEEYIGQTKTKENLLNKINALMNQLSINKVSI